MAAVREVPCLLSDALIAAIDPEILREDLSAEVTDYLIGLTEVDAGKHDILLIPLSLDRTLYEVWWAATILKLYAVKHGRYVMPMPVMGGLKRAWEGLWEVFWGIAAVKFPRHKRMSFARHGMDPCIIASPEKDNPKVRVICVGGGPEEQAFARKVEQEINTAMASVTEVEEED